MSHSKFQQRKKGFSLYVDKWSPKSKKYINSCYICGSKGYNPVILKDSFDKVLRNELLKIHNPLSVDNLNRCEICAKIQDKK